MLDNTPNQPSKFKTKKWVEINDNSRGTYNTNSHIKFKTSMLKLSLFGYSDTHILVKGTTTVQSRADVEPRQADKRNKAVIFKNCAPFTDCISEINTTQIHNAKNFDVVMQMYNLLEHSDNYLKTSGSLW